MRIFGRREPGPGDLDGPVATYAAVLDGRHLWWHVPGHDQITLRDRDDDTETTVDTDPFDLTGLAGTVWDVRAAGRPVRMAGPESLDRRPSAVPLSPDGRRRYGVTLDGRALQVRRHEPEPVTAVLIGIGTRADRVRLVVAPPGDAAPDSLLLLDPHDDGDELLAAIPTTAHGHAGRREVLIGAADLPTDHVGMLRLGVGTPDRWHRIRRGHTDLADADHAVLLPELIDQRHPDRPRARFRWSPDTLLALRCLDPAPQPGTAQQPGAAK